MRKTIAVLTAIILVFTAFSGCKKKEPERVVQMEDLVTLEQVNTDGRYAARAFYESIFTDNRELFEQCYPEGVLERLNETSEVDVFDQYKVTTNANARLIGTAYVDSRDATAENGYDEATIKASICWVTGLGYSDVEAVQLQKIRLFYVNEAESAEPDVFYVVYKCSGNWYVFSNYTGEKVF